MLLRKRNFHFSEKPSARKISMSALIPGGVSMYKRKNSHGIHLYQPTDVGSHSNSAGVDSADCYLGDESIFGRPLTEICVNTYPPVAIRVSNAKINGSSATAFNAFF